MTPQATTLASGRSRIAHPIQFHVAPGCSAWENTAGPRWSSCNALPLTSCTNATSGAYLPISSSG
jgi:hypothetical protein